MDTVDPVASADAATINSDGTVGSESPQQPAADIEVAAREETNRILDPKWTEDVAPEATKVDVGAQPQDGPTPAEVLAPQTEDGKWFANKYKHSIDEAAKAHKSLVEKLHEVQAENDRLKGPPPPPPTNEQPVEAHQDPQREFLDFIASVPEVRHLDSKITKLQGEFKAQSELGSSVHGEVADLTNQINELNQTLFTSNDYEELSSTRDQIRKLHEKKNLKESRLASINGELQRIRDVYETADASIRIAVNNLRFQFDNRKASQAQLAQQQHHQQAVQNDSVVSAIQKVTADLKIPPNQIDDFKKHLIRDGNAFLSMREDDGTPYIVEDWNAFFAERGQEFKTMVDRLHRSQSAEYADRKRADATQNAPAGTAAVAPQEKLPTSERELDAWIKTQRLG